MSTGKNAGTTTRRGTRTFDVADYLDSPEAMAAYLDAWLSEAPDDVTGHIPSTGRHCPAPRA